MIIAHDLGTTGNKATLMGADGRVTTSVTARYGTDFGAGGKVEQDPRTWWQAVCTATRRLLEQARCPPEDIAGVSFSGQMMGAVLLDEAGEPVRPAIIWADTRSVAQTGQLLERIGMEDAYRITGHRLNPTYSLEKVMWVRDNEPDAFARTRHVVLAKDYVAYLLTGALVTDPSDASSTNAYDQSTGAWSREILDAASIPVGLLPEIVPSTTVIGTVTAEAAGQTGLLAGTPVVIGGGDGPMGALGAGRVDAGSGAYCYLGSSSWVSYVADQPLHDPRMRSMTFNHVIPGQFVPTATMQAGGAAIEWITGVLAPGEETRFARLLSGSVDVRASDDGLYFLPYLLGERSPYWNPNARAVFVGLARHHGPEHLARAVVEGVAFNLYSGLRAFLENGADVDQIDVIGGGANSPMVLQELSDTWGVPVRRGRLVDEATSLGAAIVGGVGVGLFPDFEIARRLTAWEDASLPNRATHERRLRAHERFVDAYLRLEPWFDAGAA
ncbi:xylulokinase [Streptomyces sp. MMS24-I2-30]|uniref:xylulokinase n=1 Tax=Streptomyces sp. MMS24-I2-30 TaxID=3351564 RepID=UPI003896CCC2